MLLDFFLTLCSYPVLLIFLIYLIGLVITITVYWPLRYIVSHLKIRKTAKKKFFFFWFPLVNFKDYLFDFTENS